MKQAGHHLPHSPRLYEEKVSGARRDRPQLAFAKFRDWLIDKRGVIRLGEILASAGAAASIYAMLSGVFFQRIIELFLIIITSSIVAITSLTVSLFWDNAMHGKSERDIITRENARLSDDIAKIRNGPAKALLKVNWVTDDQIDSIMHELGYEDITGSDLISTKIWKKAGGESKSFPLPRTCPERFFLESLERHNIKIPEHISTRYFKD